MSLRTYRNHIPKHFCTQMNRLRTNLRAQKRGSAKDEICRLDKPHSVRIPTEIANCVIIVF